MEARLTIQQRVYRNLRLLYQAIIFEFRKVTEFRTGFLIRELLHGIARPTVMIFVYWSIFKANPSKDINGYKFVDLVHYLILASMMQKILFHNRVLDISTQIFEGYITKYFVMPFRFFILAFARFLQYTSVQCIVALIFYTMGFFFLKQWWPVPASGYAAFQAFTLVFLGSYCFFLLYFILNTLAFWLDVIWTLLVGSFFISNFISGALIPVSLMPKIMQDIFYWTFPYWTICAPVEIFIGRLQTQDFWEGMTILLGTCFCLEIIRQWTWKRGVRKYTGVGM